MSTIIRRGNERDMAGVLELLKELAIIKKQSGEVEITIYDLIKDGFSNKKIFKIFVAEKDEEIVGFALFCITYSAKGKSVVLEDVFVNSKNKKSGIGLSLFSKFLEYAKDNNIHRLEWYLLEKYDSLIKLYQRANAKILYDTRIFELNEEQIAKIVSEKFKLKEDKSLGKVVIRRGEERDMVSIFDMYKELTVYKNVTCEIEVYDLINDGCSTNPIFKTFVAEVNNEIIGMLLFFNTYSTMKGKSLILEDLHLKIEYRNRGIGKALNYKFFEYAQKNKVKRIQQAIYDWDVEAVNRCEKFGATMIEGKRIVRISDRSLHNFINRK